MASYWSCSWRYWLCYRVSHISQQTGQREKIDLDCSIMWCNNHDLFFKSHDRQSRSISHLQWSGDFLLANSAPYSSFPAHMHPPLPFLLEEVLHGNRGTVLAVPYSLTFKLLNQSYEVIDVYLSRTFNFTKIRLSE